MSRSKKKALEETMEATLRPGDFIGYRESGVFESDLDAVRGELDQLLENGQAELAVELHETFIAACYAKAEEVDDSYGHFGMFVESLFCSWIRARQTAAADPEETARLLLAWMDNDDYGFCHELEKEAVKVFDRAGKAAFEKLVRHRFEEALAKREPDQRGPRTPWGVRHAAEILKTIYLSRANAAAYLEICEVLGLTSADCEVVAEIHQKKRRYEEALEWVKRGLALDEQQSWPKHSYRLRPLQRTLLTKLGRSADARELAWSEFCAHPSEYSFAELMRYVPKRKRREWRARALKEVETTPLATRITIYLETKEWDRLADLSLRAEAEALEAISHFVTEPAAKKLEKSEPAAAARLFCAQGMRIVNAGKSKYYDAAIRNFRSARDCYARAGLDDDWLAVVGKVRSEHYRKFSFMPAFERVVSGLSENARPSFLDEARRKWRAKTRR